MRYYRVDINTNLDREIGSEFLASKNAAPESMFKSHDQGCATSLVAALDPSLSGMNSCGVDTQRSRVG